MLNIGVSISQPANDSFVAVISSARAPAFGRSGTVALQGTAICLLSPMGATLRPRNNNRPENPEGFAHARPITFME
jgi:hypothetical protein